MSNTDQAPEPTMDEILASIRRIISDEPTSNKPDEPEDSGDSVAGDIARALNFGGPEEQGVSGMDDDILELTEVVARTEPDPMMPPPAPQFGEAFTDPGQPQEQPQEPPLGMNEPQFGEPAQDNAFDSAFQQPDVFAAEPAGEAGGQEVPVSDPMGDQDIFSAPPSGTMAQGVEQDFTAQPENMATEFGDPGILDSGAAQTEEPLIDPALFAGVGNTASETGEAPADIPDFPVPEAQAPQEEPGAPLEAAADFGSNDDLAVDTSDIAAQLAQELEKPAPETAEVAEEVKAPESEVLEEELAWVDDGAELETDAVAAALEQSLAAEEEELMSEAGAELGEPPLSATDELPTDENVTFGALSPEDSVSPEDSIESALEKAIKADDIEQAWSEEPAAEEPRMEASEPAEEAPQEAEQSPISEVVEKAAAAAEQEVNAQGGEQEGVGTMDLPGVAGIVPGMEDELSSAVASVKETVAKDEKPAEPAQEVAEAKEPEVSEVVPAAAKSAAAAVVSPLEESIKDMLKPMLREWLDDNMPRLLQGAMKEAQELENKKKDD